MLIKLIRENFGILMRGIAMGAADVVPGVSGGTIAFITGIYEKLISSINNFNGASINMLFKEGIVATWKYINGTFLTSLFIGIGISILTLAKLISYLLANEAILLWSFFFGLILASIIYVGKTIKKWSIGAVFSLIIGTIISFWITVLPPAGEPESLSFIFFSGMLAICAMILPGISGSFILLLLGSYGTVIHAVKDFDVKIISIFASGCILGLLAFSKLLNWMFNRFYNMTIAVLTGFLVGSLNKIWPWKETVETRTNSHGETVPFIQENVSPDTFQVLYDVPTQLIPAIAVALLGFALIFILERIASVNKS